MDIYGLTGGIGSGKSAVAAMLEEYGVPVVSADELSRMVVAKGSDGLSRVIREFGEGLLTADGELDRKRMAAAVFSDADKRRALEEILHPLIRDRYEQVLDAMEKAGHTVAVYEVPLLFEKSLQGEMKAVVLVTASVATRIARVRARDGSTEAEVMARIRTQMPESEKRTLADYVINNEGNYDDLRQEVMAMISRYFKLPARGGGHVVHEMDDIVAELASQAPRGARKRGSNGAAPPSAVTTQPMEAIRDERAASSIQTEIDRGPAKNRTTPPPPPNNGPPAPAAASTSPSARTTLPPPSATPPPPSAKTPPPPPPAPAPRKAAAPPPKPPPADPDPSDS